MDKTERDYWETNLTLIVCVIVAPLLFASGDIVGFILGCLTCIILGLSIFTIILCIMLMKEREEIKVRKYKESTKEALT